MHMNSINIAAASLRPCCSTPNHAAWGVLQRGWFKGRGARGGIYIGEGCCTGEGPGGVLLYTRTLSHPTLVNLHYHAQCHAKRI
eukprot:1148874-Pelagomonas_calceolata.AAC.2